MLHETIKLQKFRRLPLRRGENAQVTYLACWQGGRGQTTPGSKEVKFEQVGYFGRRARIH